MTAEPREAQQRSSTAAFLEPLSLTAEALATLEARLPALWRWFDDNAREMPWRGSADPYAIWVSEVMLQQTQVATVVPYYQRWLAELPDVRALAAASEAQVLKLWEGLGYYSRARNLHRAAQRVVEQHGGEVPRDPQALRALPGVGAYTAAAVGSIAFGRCEAAVDGNVLRVLGRLVALDGEVRRAPYARALDRLAVALIARADKPAKHNEAMMELGALVCVPRAPRCDDCPLAPACLGRAAGEPERFPRKPQRRAVPHHDLAVALLHVGDALLLEQRPRGGMLAGLWDLPAARVEERSQGQALLGELLRERYGVAEARLLRRLEPVKHAYTHLRVTLHPHVMRASAAGVAGPEAGTHAGEGAPERRSAWVPLDRVHERALPRATQRVIEKLLAAGASATGETGG